jgi:hypothetical protein
MAGNSVIHSVPDGETWEGLKKGGTAEFYIVVIGLSLWIKSQEMERDKVAWTTVDDISWVIQQMMKITSPPAAKTTKKRGLEGKENEGRPKKR